MVLSIDAGKTKSNINLWLKKALAPENPSPQGFSGTTIKDTWTKPRVRVEAGEGSGFNWGGVEGWGENVDNCN